MIKLQLASEQNIILCLLALCFTQVLVYLVVIVHKVNQPTASAWIWLQLQIAKLRQTPSLKCHFINGKNILCTFFPNHSIKHTYYKQTSQVKLHHYVPIIITVYVERFAGLTIQGFSSMKFFVGILTRCLGYQSQII